ncbi:MAG TPA: tRNA (N(6)-L-threonylcarbamoyladenosine(37)-C(2))-methylthiotransferase MtaB [Bryobacteraceae bacterium]|nr:tRNA (N(6)-L-threonylcarbamoyladenosine(37)-C(2))-methylthiotransferase MtaB [Bryobacteraceae bacterium]
MQRVFIRNFGCRATQADGAAIESLLGDRALSVSSVGDADLVILNTCTVTTEADADVRKSINRVRRENPQAQILVTGCYAQRAPEELSRLPGVTWVVGNSHKTKIPEILDGHYHGQIHVADILQTSEFLSSPVSDAFGSRTRPNLKVQDGCSNVCSFCIIPSVRGPSRSMPAGRVLDEIRSLAANYREIVLTGINLGRWGREPGLPPASRIRLAGLLRLILDETPVGRLRLSSIEPMDLSDDLLDLMASDPRIARHVHAPLQSGSDSVLKRMKRRYRTRHYEDRIRRAHTLMPDAAYGADVMTGFPGETEAEFQQTVDFIERMPFTYLHVFTYSERPGTPAAAMAQVRLEDRKRRTHILRQLAESKNLTYRQGQIGQTLSAVTMENGLALTGNYLQVRLARPRPANEFADLEIGGLDPAGLTEKSGFAIL